MSSDDTDNTATGPVATDDTVERDGKAEAAERNAAAAAAPDSDDSAISRARRHGVMAVLVTFAALVLLTAAAVFWVVYRYAPDIAGIRDEIATIGRAQADVSAEVTAGLSTVESIRTNAASFADELASLAAKIDSTAIAASELQRSVSVLYEKETQTSVDWVLAEADYLILAATQRLALERDTDTAIAALRAADQRLRAADHPDFLPIREQLIKDITALEAVNRADVEGLAIYLAKTIDQVDDLPTKPIAEDVTPFGTVRENDYSAKDWRRLGYAIWTDLVELIEVKDADLPDSVLFDPELRYFLQQNLKLELASARLSVLRRDRANLEASIGLIKRLFDAYYDVGDAAVKSIVRRLDEAAALDLLPSLPNISGSLVAIRKLRANVAASAGVGDAR